MDLLRLALLFNGALVLGLHLGRRRWARALQPLLCLLLLPHYPAWGLALLLAFSAFQRLARPTPPPNPIQELSLARKWKEATDSYEELEGDQPAWVHLLACRAYARQARFPEALHTLKKTAQGPPQYAFMTMALTGSLPHLEAWLPRLPHWPEHSKLHARALCQGRAGNLEAAESLWEEALLTAPDDFRLYIEEDRQNLASLTADIDARTLEQLHHHFQKLDHNHQMANARLGPQALALILLTVLAYLLKPAHFYLAQSTLPLGLLTSLFAHYNLTHLALNMVALAGLSPLVELLYPKRFLWLYFLAGAVAGLAQLFITPQAHLVGASGAIMALFGARLALLLRYPNNHQLLLLLLIFGVQVVIDQEFPQLGGVAHMWGACSGFLFVLMSRPQDLAPQTADL
ncbi:MAG: rhomboid family intramembrane serine protease [Candidatus Eremiobacteraeota bacterium]|nr:rhomboid family intramembrane serine protease [Candidatus Eremiobacteraeota bacterium]MCW5871970.1 rhomboid family intramembrane serine protease [Candidatus Eremiobacteraeota bacterium]